MQRIKVSADPRLPPTYEKVVVDVPDDEDEPRGPRHNPRCLLALLAACMSGLSTAAVTPGELKDRALAGLVGTGLTGLTLWGLGGADHTP